MMQKSGENAVNHPVAPGVQGPADQQQTPNLIVNA